MPILEKPRVLLRPPAALAAAAALAVGAAGCGSSGGAAAGGDPAAAVPPTAPLYLEADVAPSGAAAATLDSLGRRILRTDDPARALVALLDRAGRSRGVTFAADVRPWLGRRVALAVTGTGSWDARAAVVVAESRDDAAAAARLARLVGPGSAEDSYRGVELRVDRRRATAGAVLDGHVLLGATGAVRAAVDAVKGDALAGSDRFARARDAVGGDRVGFAFADVRALLRARSSAGGPGGALLATLAGALPEWVGAGVRAEPGAVVLDVAAAGGRAAPPVAGAGAAGALASVPRGASMAVGLAGLGASLTSLLDDMAASGLGRLGVAQLEQQVRRATGLDLRDDLLSWMGSGALFVTAGRAGPGGALVVASKDPARSARAIRALGGVLRAPGGGAARARALERPGVDAGWAIRGPRGRELLVAAAGRKVVLAVGRAALAAALRPAGTLGATAAFRRAMAGLGAPPTLYADPRALAALLGGGAAHDDHAALRRALAAFGPLVGAARRDGDLVRARLRAEVR